MMTHMKMLDHRYLSGQTATNRIKSLPNVLVTSFEVFT
jgi:hypothetical protein